MAHLSTPYGAKLHSWINTEMTCIQLPYVVMRLHILVIVGSYSSYDQFVSFLASNLNCDYSRERIEEKEKNRYLYSLKLKMIVTIHINLET